MTRLTCLQEWLAGRGFAGRAEVRLLKQGGFANAVVSLVSIGNERWVIKDFSEKQWVIRHTVGRVLIRREWHAISRLQGFVGFPTEPFRVGRFAMGYRFVPGDTLAQLRSCEAQLGPDFFIALESLVKQLHQRGFVHLDVRNGKNILVTRENQPCLLDFQTGLQVRLLPKRLRTALMSIDYSGVYKWWARFDPHSLDEQRLELLMSVNGSHYLWPFARLFRCMRFITGS